MIILKITSRNRRDFYAVYACEHCDYKTEGDGYDDCNFHDNVIPKMVCAVCKKRADGTYEPFSPKYDDNEVV